MQKVKSIVEYAFTLFLLLMQYGCERKPLYLQWHESENAVVDIVTNIDVSVLTNIEANFNTDLIYEWNDSLYGKIGYTKPDTLYGEFYEKYKDQRTFLKKSEFKLAQNKRESILTYKNYDILFYNKTYRTIYYNNEYGNYVTYPEVLKTKSFAFEEEFDSIPQCEEQYSAMIENVYITENDYTIQADENGEFFYYYEIKKNIVPISYIYLIQVKIVNDNDSLAFGGTECTHMALNGVAKYKDLYKQKTTGERGCIHSYNVKPVQMKDDCEIFAERFVSYGLVNDVNSSWDNVTNVYELGIELKLSNGVIKACVADITNKIKKLPYGGIITVEIKNSDLRKVINTGGGGFNVEVSDWEKADEIEIII